MSQPLVTVYFQTYNRPHLFPEALYSIQNQTFDDFKVIIVDNGSTPPITLPKSIISDHRFSLTRIDDNDHGRMNYFDLLQTLSTRYTAFLFDDDRWSPDKLEKQIAHLESKQETVACFTYAQMIDDSGKFISNDELRNPFEVDNRSRGEWARYFFANGNCLCQPSAVIRSSALAKCQPLVPYQQLPDLLLWINLLSIGGFYIIQEALTLFSLATDGSKESAITTLPKINRTKYEQSRIYHQFFQLPEKILCEAFDLPQNSSKETICTAIFNKANECNDFPHYRFATELAEERFKYHYDKGNKALAILWEKRFKASAGESKADPSSEINISNSLSKFEGNYEKWLSKRSLFRDDDKSTEKFINTNEQIANNLLIFLRIPIGSEALLADTLDSLSQQVFSNWHLEIITQMGSPDGLDEISCLNWHTVKNIDLSKEHIDFLVETKNFDWVIEIPVGAKLDPLFTWRITIEASRHPDIFAFFVDDDCFNSSGKHLNPRFKPGANPEALQSSDLAGPICVRSNIWLVTGGTSQRTGSPWYPKLLNIAAQFGWGKIKHIPDVLISYPEKFPSDLESCLVSLTEILRSRDAGGEIIPASGLSWFVRYPLATPPLVTIVILSIGQLDFLSRCLASIQSNTDYPNFEVVIALTNLHDAPDLDNWIKDTKRSKNPIVRYVRTELNASHATRCNAGAMDSLGEFLLFLKEESVVIQKKWLEELVRTGAQPGIGGVSPRMIQPGNAMIESAGNVLGLNGIAGSPYQGKTKLGDEPGYLDCIQIARDVSTLPAACMLIRKESYLKAGCMDEADLGNNLAEIDLCLKLRRIGERLIYQPLSTIVSSDTKEAAFNIDPSHFATLMLSEARAKRVFSERWFPEAATDPFWNPALSLAKAAPTPEGEFVARWQTIPSDLPRILAHPIPNAQGDFRVIAPLNALAKAGMASECIWKQRIVGEPRFHSIAEIANLRPDSIIVQNYINTPALTALQEWNASGCRPFTVYALDDLITDMDVTNPYRKSVPANARARLQYALQRCDRLVVSTNYLADAYRGFVADIRVVPNRLEQESWLHLRTKRRTGSKPRIGWAGGNTHQGDLLLLKEIMEQTRDEADWIFFGMCPDHIRPLIAEFHKVVHFSEYPAYLASLNLDLAVAPLAQTAFNRGKSNLRLLDYGILGIPVVCTDIEPYQNSPACRVSNTTTAWTEAIRAHINDPEAREREGDALRRWVLKEYLLENHLEEWLKAHLPS